MANKPEVIKMVEKRMPWYGESNFKTRTGYVNPAKGKGIEYLDTTVHERNHITNQRMSERGIIAKTEKDINSYLSII